MLQVRVGIEAAFWTQNLHKSEVLLLLSCQDLKALKGVHVVSIAIEQYQVTSDEMLYLCCPKIEPQPFCWEGQKLSSSQMRSRQSTFLLFFYNNTRSKSYVSLSGVKKMLTTSQWRSVLRALFFKMRIVPKSTSGFLGNENESLEYILGKTLIHTFQREALSWISDGEHGAWQRWLAPQNLAGQ